MAAVAVQPMLVVLTVGSEFLSRSDYFFNLDHGFVGDLQNNVNWNGGIFTPFQIYIDMPGFVINYGGDGCWHVGDTIHLVEMLVVGYNASTQDTAQHLLDTPVHIWPRLEYI